MRKFMLSVAGLVLLFTGAPYAQAAGAAPAQAAAAAHAPDIVGNWQGTLQAGKGLRTIVRVSKVDGKLKAVLYSIDQTPRPIEITSTSLEGSTVTFEIKPLELVYTGTLSPDGKTIAGKSVQGGQSHELDLQRVTDEAMWPIPEAPKPMPADAKPVFDVLTVKPSNPDRPGKLFSMNGRHIFTINTTVNDLITMAYGLHVKEIINGPDWFATDKFDIDGIPDIEGQPNNVQFKLLFQSALTQRFGLVFHHEDKELAVYALTVGKGGPKMKVTSDKPSDPKNFFFRKLGQLNVSNMTMRDFADGMQSAVMDKPVVDHTGLTDRYDFQLTWTPDESQFAAMGAHIPPPTDDAAAPPGLYTALQEQLGLKMEATKAMAPAMVIDKAEKPGAN
jgi:uncharacterized protein (TIGR03435 family)